MLERDALIQSKCCYFLHDFRAIDQKLMNVQLVVFKLFPNFYQPLINITYEFSAPRASYCWPLDYMKGPTVCPPF